MGTFPETLTMPLRLLGSVLMLGLIAGTGFAQVNPESDLPPLIRKASPKVRKAWLEVDTVVRENETRPNPLPEPYVARAEIWSLVGNYDDALADYVKATEYLFKQKPTLIEQARYLARIQETLSQMGKQGRPYYPEEGSDYYEKGRQLYFKGELNKALDYFNAAVQLVPQESVFWYYRGLTYKRLGKDTEAERDVKIGAGIVRQAEENNRDINKEVGVALERVQGSLRNWLTETARELPSRKK
jgi:tetratricopeptide (TPR) repeat protein